MIRLFLRYLTAIVITACVVPCPAIAAELFTRIDDRSVEIESPLTYRTLLTLRQEIPAASSFAVRIDPKGFNERFFAAPLPSGQATLFERRENPNKPRPDALDGVGVSGGGTTANLHLNGETVNGYFRANGRSYRVVATEDRFAIIHLVDESKRAPMHPADYDRMIPGLRGGITGENGEDGNVRKRPLAVANARSRASIDILVVYTDSAAQSVGGDSALRTYVENENAALDGALAWSEIFADSRVVSITKVKFAESNNFESMRSALMADVPIAALRKSTSADIVVLMTGQTSLCGLATLGAKTPETAYAVVSTQNYCGETFAFAHEVGHVVGADHDIAHPTPGAYPYGHGFTRDSVNKLNCYKTIMSYRFNCSDYEKSHPYTIKYFSTPDVIAYTGGPHIGSALSNNARVWNENALMVSSFDGGTSTTRPATSEAGLTAAQLAAVISIMTDLMMSD